MKRLWLFLLLAILAAACGRREGPPAAGATKPPATAGASSAAMSREATPPVAATAASPAASASPSHGGVATPAAPAEDAWTAPDERGLQYRIAAGKRDYLAGEDVLAVARVRSAGAQAVDAGAELCGWCLADGLALATAAGSELLRGPHEAVEHSHLARWLAPGEEVAAPPINLCLVNVSQYWLQVLAQPGSYRLSWRGAAAAFAVRQRPEEADRAVYLPAAPRPVSGGLEARFELERRELRPGQSVGFRLVVANPGPEARRAVWCSFLLPRVARPAGADGPPLESFAEIALEVLPPPEIVLAPGEELVSRGRYRFERKERGYCLGNAACWVVIPAPGEYLLEGPAQMGQALLRLSWDEGEGAPGGSPAGRPPAQP